MLSLFGLHARAGQRDHRGACGRARVTARASDRTSSALANELLSAEPGPNAPQLKKTMADLLEEFAPQAE